MALSSWPQAELRDRTIGGVWEKYLYGGGWSFSRRFHPNFVGAWTEHRLFVLYSFKVFGTPLGSAAGAYDYTPGGPGLWSFGLQHDPGPSMNNSESSCPLLLGVSAISGGTAQKGYQTTGGFKAVETRYSWRRIEGGVRTDGSPQALLTYFSGEENNSRNILVLRYLNLGGGVYDMSIIHMNDSDAPEVDFSQNDMVDLYNIADWNDIVSAVAPYGYIEDKTNMLGISLDEATYGKLNAVYFTNNNRYQPMVLSALFGKVIP